MDEALNTLESAGHIVVIDVNAMMAFNHVHGHAAGDAVLVTIANRLRTGVGDRGMVFRLGVDFVVLLPSVDSARAELLVTELLASIAEPVTFTTPTLGGVESASVSASAGMAAVHPGEAHRNLRQADGALYRARCQGVPYAIYKATDPDE